MSVPQVEKGGISGVSGIPWLRERLPQVLSALEQTRRSMTVLYSDDSLRRQTRRLSEMQLCQSWYAIQKACGELPEGYRIVDGFVNTYNQHRQRLTTKEPHVFLARQEEDGSTTVLCHSSAQFIRPVSDSLEEDPQSIGKRLQELRARAVAGNRLDMFVQIHPEVGVVEGSVADIKHVLGLEFIIPEEA